MKKLNTLLIFNSCPHYFSYMMESLKLVPLGTWRFNLLKTGNIFANDAEALVNTVNTVGVMGKGVASNLKSVSRPNTNCMLRPARMMRVR